MVALTKKGITAGLFRASFVATRQLWKDSWPSLSGHQHHFYSPIWGSDGGLPTQAARNLAGSAITGWQRSQTKLRSLLAYSMFFCDHKAALKRLTKSLMVTSTTPTQQSRVLMKGCQHRLLETWQVVPSQDGSAHKTKLRSLLAYSMLPLWPQHCQRILAKTWYSGERLYQVSTGVHT